MTPSFPTRRSSDLPELAAHIACERTVRELDTAATEAALAAGALSPPIDLLQYDFARTAPRLEGWPAWRRATILAGMLAASPLVMLAAQVAQSESSAERLGGKACVMTYRSRRHPYL